MAEAPAGPPAPEARRGGEARSGAPDCAPGAGVPTAPSTNGERGSVLRPSGWMVARYTLIVLVVLGGVYLLWRIQEVLLLLLLAILFATAIEPLVNWLRRGPFSRGQGILIVYSGIFAALVALGVLLLPSLVGQLTQFVGTLPQQVAALQPRVEQIDIGPLRALLLRGLAAAGPAVEHGLEEPVGAAQADQLVGVGGAFAHTLFSIITVFLLAYYWLTERSAIKRAVLRLVPSAHARHVNATWLEVEDRLGAWVRGQLLVMLAIGMMAGVAFVLLGLPNSLVLMVLAGLFEIIPMVGPFLAFVPAFLVALVTDPFKALLLVPIALVIQQIEGNILIPRIMSQAVGVSPLTVVLGILIGAILYGPAGAFLAVPVAAALQVILNHTLRPALDEPTPDVPVPEAELEGDRQPDPNTLLSQTR
ncbi:MAG TPA: AI-2E family transporter [Chloroflexota bacterium]|nr:AI-2E family transporter [Chloroflexota bacterium]